MEPVADDLATKIRLAWTELDNLRLQGELLQVRFQQGGEKRDALIEQARTAVGAGPTQVYNLETCLFQDPATGPRPLSAPRAKQQRRLASVKRQQATA